VNDTELFEMLTVNPARVWDLNAGKIEKNMDADIVVATGDNSFDSFYSLDPENILVVIQNGEIRLFDESLYTQLEKVNFGFEEYSTIEINGTTKYVQGDLPKLIRDINTYNLKAVFPVNY